MADGGSDTGSAGELASVRARVLARLVDAGVAVALAAGVVLVFGAASAVEVPEPREAVGVVAFPLLVALAGVVALEAVGVVAGGATLGKALFGLRVVSASAEPLVWRGAVVRGLWSLAEVPLFPVALLLMRRSDRRQRWADRVAGTVVVSAWATEGVARRAARSGVVLSVAVYLAACLAATWELHRNEETAMCDHADDAAYRDVCLARVAVASNEPGLCERSASATGRDDCYSRVGLGLGSSWCQKVEAPEARDGCYVSSARGDASVCAKAQDVGAQERCITKVAATTHDPKLCEPLKTQREACLAAAGPVVDGGDPCASKPSSSGRDACYRQKGACEQVESPPGRDQCYLAIDKASGDDCPKIASPFVQADCVTAVAGSKQDPSLCDGIGAKADNPARRHCYDQAFAKTTSTSICARFTDPATRDDCAYAAATNAHAPALCAKIGDAVRRKACGVLAGPGAPH